MPANLGVQSVSIQGFVVRNEGNQPDPGLKLGAWKVIQWPSASDS